MLVFLFLHLNTPMGRIDRRALLPQLDPHVAAAGRLIEKGSLPGQTDHAVCSGEALPGKSAHLPTANGSWPAVRRWDAVIWAPSMDRTGPLHCSPADPSVVVASSPASVRPCIGTERTMMCVQPQAPTSSVRRFGGVWSMKIVPYKNHIICFTSCQKRFSDTN